MKKKSSNDDGKMLYLPHESPNCYWHRIANVITFPSEFNFFARAEEFFMRGKLLTGKFPGKKTSQFIRIEYCLSIIHWCHQISSVLININSIRSQIYTINIMLFHKTSSSEKTLRVEVDFPWHLIEWKKAINGNWHLFEWLGHGCDSNNISNNNNHNKKKIYIYLRIQIERDDLLKAYKHWIDLIESWMGTSFLADVLTKLNDVPEKMIW